MGESEVQNFVRSGEVASQPMDYGQREVSHSVVSMEVCSEGSLYPGFASAQQPVVGACPDLSVVNEVSEASHNPSYTADVGRETQSKISEVYSRGS